MVNQRLTKLTTALYVGVGISNYDHPAFNLLPQALTEVEDIAEILKTYRYEAHVIIDPGRASALGKLEDNISKDSISRGGSLVVFWAGHGEPTPEGQLHLIAKDGKPGQAPLITSDFLASLAARTGAGQILLILDTCYSGVGAIPAIEIADRVIRELPPDSERVWFGVIASAMAFERAKDGLFGSRLSKLLRDGPSNSELRLRWSAHSAGVRGDDLIDALLKEWDIPEQRPKHAAVGDPWIMLPNPNYDPNAPEHVVEHLLLAARGVDSSEDGFYFTGRETVLKRIISWMEADKPGTLVLTGPAGSGKSAIAGRIVSLSNPVERSRICSHSPLGHGDIKEGTIHAHVHARGITADRICHLLEEQLVRRGVLQMNPAGPRNRWELLGAIERSRTRLIFVVDGVDEGGPEAWKIAEDVIRLLAKKSLVLVSTRDLPSREDGFSLIQTLCPSEIVDLGEESIQEETHRDICYYIEKRLAQISDTMDPTKISDAVVHIACQQGGGVFLLARVITTQLRSNPVDTSIYGWEDCLDRSIEAAFDRDILKVPSLYRDELELPYAAQELLAALAWGYGSGLPDDIWPIVATALSPTGSTYLRSDVFWILSQAGHYVVEGGEGDRAVYHLAHQRLVEHLHPKPITIPQWSTEEEHAARIAQVLVVYNLQLLERGHYPKDHFYLWNYVWCHCADAGETGIDALRKLVQTEPEAFLPDLASALNNLGNHNSNLGNRLQAVAPTEESVEIRRELAKLNPAFFPDLALALNNLGIRYNQVGKRMEAMAPTEEAVKIYKRLAKTNAAFLPDLAMALNNLGIRFSQVGKFQEALAPTELAVKIRRKLAKSNPAFLSDLAGTLHNLGSHYSKVGRRQEALIPVEEAVSIRRGLSDSNPAFLPDLASALNNLGAQYGQAGRYHEALALTEESVKIYSEHAKTNLAFLPDLASTLNNLGVCYKNVGKNHEALVPTEEAVKVYRELAKTNPAFLPDLASSLSNLGIRFSQLGMIKEALAPTEEAVKIRRELAMSNPAFLSDLASVLTNLSNRYSQAGKLHEALAPTEEAIKILRILAKTNPAFLPALARSFFNLGNHHSQAGNLQAAVAPTEEAVKIRRELAKTNPVFLSDLADASNSLGITYSKIGKEQEALAPINEAVKIYCGLAETNPAFLPDLAMSLYNLGICYSLVGNRQEALASTEKAVKVYRELVDADPRYLRDLADSLKNLNRYLHETT